MAHVSNEILISGTDDKPAGLEFKRWLFTMAVAQGDIPAQVPFSSPPEKVVRAAQDLLIKFKIAEQADSGSLTHVSKGALATWSRRLFGAYESLKGTSVWKNALESGGRGGGVGPAPQSPISKEQQQILMKQLMELPGFDSAFKSGNN